MQLAVMELPFYAGMTSLKPGIVDAIVIPVIAENYTAIAPDICGYSDSDKPMSR